MNNFCYNNDEIVVATSIVPRNLENQKKAIDTWIEAGIKVVSFNCIEEFEKIKNHFKEVDFVIVERDARNEYKKPYIYFYDIMLFFQNISANICGIINSDIHFRDIDDGFIQFVKNEAEKAVIFGSRIEIDSIDSYNGFMLNNGFDYFFFNRQISFLYPNEDFCLGQPVWDYWILFIPIINRIQIKKIVNPIAYHIKHPINWSTDTDQKFRELIIKKYRKEIIPYEYAINWEKKFIHLLRIINDNCEEYVISDNLNISYSVLVVYDNNGRDIKDSETYKSIINQTYNNITVKIGKKENFNTSEVKHDVIYFVKDGCILNKNFFALMCMKLKSCDYVICGVKLSSNEYGLVRDRYPLEFDKFILNTKELVDEVIIYKVDFYKRLSCNKVLLDKNNFGFIGNNLAEFTHMQYLKNRLELIKNKVIFIYGAGGNTKKLLNDIDFSSYNISGIIDKNEELDNKVVYGYRSYHISKINNLNFDYIIISSVSYEREICEELLNLIDEDKIIKIYYV